jgi:hypothetical protein
MSLKAPRARAAAGALGALAALGGWALPDPAAARGEWFLGAGATAAGVEDSNLFAEPEAPRGDHITRLTPAAEAGYRSARLSLDARYDRDLERFADHPGLDSDRARQRAALALETRPGRALTLDLRGAYETTLTPADFNAITGLAAGRRPARRLAVGSTLSRRFGRGRATFGATRTVDRLVGGLASATETLDLGLERRLSGRSAWSLDYQASRYRFATAGAAERSTAQALTFGWSRAVGRRTDLSLKLGPRLTEGEVDPEAAFALAHRGRRGALELAYDRTLATVFGFAGAVTAERLSASIAWHPGRGVRIAVTPAAFRVRGAGGAADSRVRRVALEASAPLGRWFLLTGAWDVSRQEGAPGASAPGAEDQVIARRTVLFALTVRAPERAAPDRRPPAGDEPWPARA